jgi:hypothetical protein
MKQKFANALSLALIVAMLFTSIALADNVQGDDVDAGGDTTKTPGQLGTATFQLAANGPDGCNVDESNSATATVVSNQSWLTIDSPESVTFTQCGSAGAELIGYSVSSLAPIGGVAEISVSSVTGGKTGNNGWNLPPSKFTVIVVAPPPPSDTTPPVVTPNISGTLGNNGWYVSDVTVTWGISDPDSAVTSTTGCDATTIDYDTTGVTLTCEATSAGGTSSESVTIKRDATAPTFVPTVSPNPVLLNGAATASANASDNLSGVASSSCDPVDTSAVGSHSVTCYATDNAGNSNSATAYYSVIYNWNGFFQPVDNIMRNGAKAGQAIPLKWRLTDANGAPVLNLASVTVSVQSLSCSLGTTTDELEEYAAGSSGLQNLGDGYYQFNWKTPTSYASSCKTMSLWLGDGVAHTAQFQFKK